VKNPDDARWYHSLNPFSKTAHWGGFVKGLEGAAINKWAYTGNRKATTAEMEAGVQALGENIYRGIELKVARGFDQEGTPLESGVPFGRFYLKETFKIWDAETGQVDFRLKLDNKADIIGGGGKNVDVSIGGYSIGLDFQASLRRMRLGGKVKGEAHGWQVTTKTDRFHIPIVGVDSIGCLRMRLAGADTSAGLMLDWKNKKIAVNADAMAEIIQWQGVLDTFMDEEQALRLYVEALAGAGGGGKIALKWGLPPVEINRLRWAEGVGGGGGLEYIDREDVGEP